MRRRPGLAGLEQKSSLQARAASWVLRRRGPTSSTPPCARHGRGCARATPPPPGRSAVAVQDPGRADAARAARAPGREAWGVPTSPPRVRAQAPARRHADGRPRPRPRPPPRLPSGLRPRSHAPLSQHAALPRPPPPPARACTQPKRRTRARRAEISKNPAFRSQFHTMCRNIGVDPLASNKGAGPRMGGLLGMGGSARRTAHSPPAAAGPPARRPPGLAGFWSQMLGFGDFYYELGVQIGARKARGPADCAMRTCGRTPAHVRRPQWRQPWRRAASTAD